MDNNDVDDVEDEVLVDNVQPIKQSTIDDKYDEIYDKCTNDDNRRITDEDDESSFSDYNREIYSIAKESVLYKLYMNRGQIQPDM